MSDPDSDIDDRIIRAINFGRDLQREVKGPSPVLFLFIGMLLGFIMRGVF